MIKLTLKRTHENEFGTHGQFQVTDEIICFTLEPLWKNNKRDVSCIPAGTYKMTRHDSPNHGDVFKIHNVPKRGDILVHPGNTIKDTLGCALPGLERETKEVPEGLKSVKLINSCDALDLLKDKFGYEDIELTITQEY
jgi:hypothetical protein